MKYTPYDCRRMANPSFTDLEQVDVIFRDGSKTFGIFASLVSFNPLPSSSSREVIAYRRALALAGPTEYAPNVQGQGWGSIPKYEADTRIDCIDLQGREIKNIPFESVEFDLVLAWRLSRAQLGGSEE